MALINGFELLYETPLPEYRGIGARYRHVGSGADVFHVRNDDPENLFAFAFKTLPADSTGIAHILEHTVLCGSRAYPLKDPFIRLVKGSLNTFLNAMTYPDKTVYPAASTVAKDLFNIMEVYGDAVFFPLLRREFFQQEGHRLQYSDGRLELTGIVYNEMSGVYADHDSVAGRIVHQAILCDTPYGYDSGGDPHAIPDLTYDAFVDFHATCYHPSNALIFLYGDIATERYLEFLDSRFLSRFEAAGRAPAASTGQLLQPRWSEPREFTVTCPTDGDDGPTSITLSWLIGGDHSPEELLALELLAYILLGSSAGPLRRALIESGLGDDLSAPTGMETDVLEPIFSVGLRDTDVAHKDQIESLVLDSLSAIARDGIDAGLIESSLRKVEFRNREIKGGGPNGLRLMGRSLRGWLHGESPEHTLRFEEPLRRVRDAVAAEPRYFERLIGEHLIGNTHRLLSIVLPDGDQRAREAQALSTWLAERERALSPDDRARIESDQAALDQLQKSADPPEAVSSLPVLRVADLPREIERVPTAIDTIAGVPLYTHDVPANGIVYIDIGFDLGALDSDLLAYVPLYVDAFGELGLPGRSYDEVITDIGLKSGGMSAFHEAGMPADGSAVADRRLFFRVKTLESTLGEAVDLLTDLIVRPDYSNARRVSDVFKEARSSMSGSVLPSGHSYAAVRAGRAYSDADRYGELWHGATQLLFMSSLGEDGAGLAEPLARIGDAVIRRGGALVNLTGSSDACAAALPHIERLVGALPDSIAASRDQPRSPLLAVEPVPAAEALIIPSNVCYVALAMRGARFGTDDHVHEQVLAHLLRTGPLWESVRMTGGAYGVSASARGMDGVFGFWSYRDPAIVPTLDAFRASLTDAAGGVLPGDLEQAVIGVAGRYYRPQSPSEKALVGLRRTLYRIPDEVRDRNHRVLLETKVDDVVRVARRLVDSYDDHSIVVLAGVDAIDRASAELPVLGERRIQLPL